MSANEFTFARTLEIGTRKGTLLWRFVDVQPNTKLGMPLVECVLVWAYVRMRDVERENGEVTDGASNESKFF